MGTTSVTTCVDCGGDLVPTETTEDLPVVTHEMECASCGHTAVVSVLHYTEYDFEAIIESSDGEMCYHCTDNAEYRVERVGGRPIPLCEEHAGEHRITVVES